LHPDLEQLREELAAIQTDVGRMMTGIRDDQFYWRAAPGQWSICECLTHLNVVDGLDVEPLARAVIEARANGWTSNGPFRYGPIAAWFIGKMEPPVKLKTKAPKIYVPPPDQPRDTVIDEFHRIHDRLVEILSMADGLDLARIKVPTPFSKWIRFRFTQRIRLITAHDRRHLWQAWQVPSFPGFPG
jgi:DinB superfamily